PLLPRLHAHPRNRHSHIPRCFAAGRSLASAERRRAVLPHRHRSRPRFCLRYHSLAFQRTLRRLVRRPHRFSGCVCSDAACHVARLLHSHSTRYACLPHGRIALRVDPTKLWTYNDHPTPTPRKSGASSMSPSPSSRSPVSPSVSPAFAPPLLPSTKPPSGLTKSNVAP